MNKLIHQTAEKNINRNILSLVVIFIILFIGAHQKNFSGYPVFFYGYKYGLIASLLLLSIYLFKNENILGYLKLTLFIPFTNDYLLHLSFIFLTLILFNKKLFVKFNSPLKMIYLLFGFSIFSYIVNQFIEINLLSLPLFTYTFFLSFIFFGLFYNLGVLFKDELVNFFYNIVLTMSLVIIFQIILHPEYHPDFWDGGTPNAHIAASYISIAFIMSLVKLERAPARPFNIYFREIVIAIISLPLLFLTDAKYFFLLSLFILIIYFLVFKFVHREVKALSFGVLAVLIIVFFSTPEKPLPISILTLNASKYNVERLNAQFYNSPRYHLLQSAIKLPFENPLTFLIGSGPGTFISRSAYLQYNLSKSEKHKVFNEGREKYLITSELAHSETWIRDKYAKDAFEYNFDPGSLFNRRTGLVSIYFELGIIGLLLFVLFHVHILKIVLKNYIKVKDTYLLAVIPLIVLFLIINYFSYWCEYPNYCIIQYGILGILLSSLRSGSTENIK